jgi:outer membrane protein OmpA-like peptidoglycan-associated protein
MYKNIFLIPFLYLLVACSTVSSNDDQDTKTSKQSMAAVKLSQTIQGVKITTDDSVLFDVGSTSISSAGNNFLDKVAEMLRDKTKANILIEGHTDSTGNIQINSVLSEKRSTSVKEGLIARKISASRINSKGYGQSKPVAENDTPEGRQMNRRSEIIVLGETVERVGGTDLLNNLTLALGNFIKDAGTTIGNSVSKIGSFTTKISRSVGGVGDGSRENTSANKK